MTLQYNRDGSVDITLNHPTLGNIPFTSNPIDTDTEAKKVWADVQAGKYGTINPYPAADKLKDAQATAVQKIEVAYRTAIQQDVTYNGTVFQADKNSQDLIKSAIIGFGSNPVPAGFYWVAKDNSQPPFTKTDLDSLAGLMIAQGWIAFQKLQTAKKAIRNATTVAEVEAVTF